MEKTKILIVDDEPDILETVQFRLENAGYEVITAGDGITAIRLAKERTPALIIMDIMMPGMDGSEALKALKKDASTKWIPTIIFSCGREEEGWAKRALQLGSAGYVVKPFDGDALLFIVQKFTQRASP